MLNKTQVFTAMKNFYPNATIKAWTQYHDLYLFRIEHPSESEKNYDPFFSVNPITEEVQDFSVLTDIKSSDFDKLEWKEVL